MVCPLPTKEYLELKQNSPASAMLLAVSDGRVEVDKVRRAIGDEARRMGVGTLRRLYPQLLASLDTLPKIINKLSSLLPSGGVVIGDHYEIGDTKYPLFPKPEINTIKPSEYFSNVLENLAVKFDVPYEVINDVTQKFKGKYINDASGKRVIVNTAYATPDTPFHEYFHPFVRILMNESPEIFNKYYTEARFYYPKLDPEEAVTQYMGMAAVANRKPQSLLQFLQYIGRLISDLLGLTVNIKPSDSIKSVVDRLISEGYDVSRESTLTEAYQLIEQIENTVGISAKVRDEQFGKDLAEWAKDLTTNDDSRYYSVNGVETYKRATDFVSSKTDGTFTHTFANGKSTDANLAAATIFASKGLAKDQTIEYYNRVLTFEQLVELIDSREKEHIYIGKMRHAYMQYLLEEDSAVREKALKEANFYASKMVTPYTSLEEHPLLKSLTRDIRELKEDYLDIADGPKGDKLYLEKVLLSEILKDKDGNPLGSTADVIVEHYNSDLSLIDYKSEGITAYSTTAALMPYGEKLGIHDNPLSRAFMELTIRAFMLKEKFPEKRFSKLRIVKLDKYGNYEKFDADIALYLRALEAYVQKTNKASYEEANKKGLFKADNYYGSSSVSNAYREMIKGLGRNEAIKIVDAKMAALNTLPDSDESKTELKDLAAIRLELEGYQDIETDLSTADIGQFKRWMGNLSDIDKRSIQGFNDILSKARVSENKEKIEIVDEWEKRLAALHKERPNYDSTTNKVLNKGIYASILFGVVTGQPWWVGFSLAAAVINRRSLQKTRNTYDFMFVESGDVARPGTFLNTSDYYKGRSLTKAEKDVRDYYINTIRNTYREVMEQTVGTDKFGRPISKARSMKVPEELPEDFFARVPMTYDESRESAQGIESYLGIKSFAEYAVKSNIASLLERDYSREQGDDRWVKVKYLDQRGSIAASGHHSFNIDLSFKAMMGNLLHKKHFDDLYPFAQGIKAIIHDAKDLKGEELTNLLGFFNDQVALQVLRKEKEARFTSKPLTVKINDRIAKILGVKAQTYEINQDQLIRSFKSGLSFISMAFKFVPALKNITIITLTNFARITNSFFYKLYGADTDEAELIKAGSMAVKDWAGYVKDAMTDNLNNNKLGVLSKEFDWLPDNSDYGRAKRELLLDITKPSIGGAAFMFHSFTETYGAMTHLAAALRAMTIDVNGVKKSVWDLYSVKDGKLVWSGPRRVNSLGEEFDGLDSREIKNLKRLYEKTQGGYRPEEYGALEASVWGQFLTQFRRYFYTYTKNLLASDYTDATLGRYVESKSIKRPDGVPVYEWEQTLMKGRLRVMAGGILALVKQDGQYLQGKDGESRRKRLAELSSTGMWVLLSYLAYLAFIDDGDDELTKREKWFKGITTDAASGLHWKDYLAVSEQPIVITARGSTIAKSFLQIVGAEDATMQVPVKDPVRSRKQGFRNLERNVPFLGNMKSVTEILGNAKWDDTKSMFGYPSNPR